MRIAEHPVSLVALALVAALFALGCLESNPQPSPQDRDRERPGGEDAVRPPPLGEDIKYVADDVPPSPTEDAAAEQDAMGTMDLVADAMEPADVVEVTDGGEVEVFVPECDDELLCAEGFLCEPPGLCICDCTPQCEDKQCGDDGCFGSCGDCPEGKVCVGSTCCTPYCYGMACGDDGCGGTCGQCEPGTACSEAGTCEPCTPQCDGKECGDDGCGGLCGTCPDGVLCIDGMCTNACLPLCDGKACGDDGCGGACGMCEDGFICNMGKCCPADCEPQCEGKQCGPDGCGCSCGKCPNSLVCLDGECAPAPKGPCLRPEDCYAAVPEYYWPDNWVPVCKPGTCTCSAKKL